MFRLFCFVLLSILTSHPAWADIPRWDALPAIDVQHLQGPYAGRTVCPMCQHGYDAGVLVFLPSDTPPGTAARIARVLRETTHHIQDARFRPFLIFTGDQPSAELLTAVESPDTNWYVAHLESAALPNASKDFKRALRGHAYGYVFAQRRMLWAFNPEQAGSSWARSLQDYSDYGMTFLQANYAHAAPKEGMDTPKGRLWIAPNHLSSTVAIADRVSSPHMPVCFVDYSGSPASGALVAVSLPRSQSPTRIWWATADTSGCLSLSGVQRSSPVHAEIFRPLKRAVNITFDSSRLSAAAALRVPLESAGQDNVSDTD